jgi:hypothetical protein
MVSTILHNKRDFLCALCGSSEQSERARDKVLRHPSFAMILLRRTGALCAVLFFPSPQRESRRRENTQLLSLKYQLIYLIFQ